MLKPWIGSLSFDRMILGKSELLSVDGLLLDNSSVHRLDVKGAVALKRVGTDTPQAQAE